MLLVVVVAGCGSRRPKWLGGRHESDVIQPTNTSPLQEPTPTPTSGPAPTPLTEESPSASVGDVPGASKTLSQAEPTLLGEEETPQDEQPLSLTDLESLGGDLPWAGAKPDTLSERIAQSGPKIEYQPRLAPLPEEEEIVELETEEAQKAAQKKKKPAPTPPGDSPDDLRSQMTAAGGSATAPDTQTQEQAEAIEEVKRPFVEGKEEIVAGMTLQINDQHVTVDEILAGLHKELANIPKHVSREKFRTMAAEIITREMWYEARSVLMYAEAQRRLEDNIKEKIKEEMADVKRELIAETGGSVEALKEKFRREGTTYDDAMKTHERDLTTRYYMQVKFGPAIVVNRRMMWNYYKKHKTDFVVEREVQMQIIAAPFRLFLPEDVRNPTDEELDVAKAQARETIEKAAAALEKGKDFGETAKLYSRDPRAKQGGIWPMMPAGNFRNTRVEEEAFTLKEGKYSGVIEGKDGYYIVRALKVNPGKATPFVDAQDKIETILRNEQYDKLSREYMNKLYENAVIDSPPDFIPTAVERALERYKGKE